MALLLMDGFETYASGTDNTHNFINLNQTYFWIQTAEKRSGNACLSASDANIKSLSTKSWPGTNPIVVGFAFRPGNSYNWTDFDFFSLYTSSGNFGLRHLNVDKVLRVMKNGSQIGTAYTCLENVYYYIELKIYVHASAGYVQVRINGVEQFSLANANTTIGASSLFTYAAFRTGNETRNYQIDDFYVLDTTGSVNNDFLGPINIAYAAPTSDQSVSFTPLTGPSNYTEVDDAWSMDSDTSYVTGEAIGNSDLYGHAGLPASGYTYLAVQPVLSAKSVTAVPADLGGIVKSGVTEQEWVAWALTNGAYTHKRGILEVDPNTSAAWTASAINALQFGHKIK